MTTLEYGLQIWEVQPNIQAQAHQHNDIELIHIEHGSVAYRYNARSMMLKAGDVMLFWAAIPHQLKERFDNCTMHIITIPINVFLNWGLRTAFVDDIMCGNPLIHTEKHITTNLVEIYFRQWQRDLHMASPERRDIVLLEVQAIIKRLSLYKHATAQSTMSDNTSRQSAQSRHAHKIADYIAGHYTQVLSLKRIAAVLDIHPSYASTIFTTEFDVTIWDYLAQHRVAHAQRLLLLTDDRIDKIAEQSGFTSISQFYAVFKRLCNQTPKQFRSASS